MGSTAELGYVQNALLEAKNDFRKRNPRSHTAHQDARSHLPGGNTRTVLHAEPYPMTWSSGKAAMLTSADGDVYLDFLGEFSAGIFGHSNQRIYNAVRLAMEGGWNFGGNSIWEKTLAKKICERFRPSGLDLVRFTNSGTESNTTALAAAVAITGKEKVLVFSSGYHGSTLVFPPSNIPNRTFSVMNLPHEFVYAPYNNIEETRLILSSADTHRLAAILVEPIQGSGGCRPASPQFLRFLREVADTTGALLIIDEVMASRLGKSGYAAEVGIKADFMTLGKYLGGGMTFGAFGGSRDIMERFDPSKAQLFHPGTYNNNVLSMAAGIEGLDIYTASEVERLNDLGDNLKSRIQKILIDNKVYPSSIKEPSATLIEVDSLVGPTKFYVGKSLTERCETPFMMITGQGSMLNVRFNGKDAAYWQALFYHFMLARDIYVATRGYTPLNLCLTEDDISQYTAAVLEFVSQHKAHFHLFS